MHPIPLLGTGKDQALELTPPERESFVAAQSDETATRSAAVVVPSKRSVRGIRFSLKAGLSFSWTG